MLKGGWWWKSCGRGLNGLYLNDPQDLTARQGLHKLNNFNVRLFKVHLSVSICDTQKCRGTESLVSII